MLNEVFLIGRLGSDPEERMMQNGDRIVSVSVATFETWKDSTTGEKKERTEWHKVVIFNQIIAKMVMSYFKKGALVFVQGKIRSRKWTDPNTSVERTFYEIVVDRFEGKVRRLADGGSTERSTHADTQMFGSDFTPASNTPSSFGGSKQGASREKHEPAHADADEDFFKDHIPF